MILPILFAVLGALALISGVFRLFHDPRLLENRNAAMTFLLLQAGQGLIFLALYTGSN